MKNLRPIGNRKILHEILQQKFSTMSLDEIMKVLRTNDIPVGKLNNIQDLVKSEVVEWDILGNILIPRLPLPGCLDGQDVPALGENTLDILKDLGYSKDEIEKMIKEKIIIANLK